MKQFIIKTIVALLGLGLGAGGGWLFSRWYSCLGGS